MTAHGDNDLEHRRRAIVAALTDASVSPEPPPARPAPARPVLAMTAAGLSHERLTEVERAIAELRLQLAHVQSRLDDAAYPDDSEVVELPELESADRPRLFSERAAVALFGSA